MSQQQPPQPASNGHNLDDKQASGAPNSTLDIYDSVVNPETSDDISSNLGTGFYTEDEQWQQVSSYRKGMFGEAAFARRLFDRALSETIQELGRKGWRYYDEDEGQHGDYKEHDGVDLERELADEEMPRPREVVRKHGERLWRKLPDAQQVAAMQEFSGYSGNWMPPHWRMMETRHEASKSREARTQDNLFGTRNKQKVEEHRDSPRRRGFRGRFNKGEKR